MATYYRYGDNKALCDMCGRAVFQSTLRQQWDNLFTCKRCYDPKHPDLEPINSPPEDPMIPNSRPRPEFDNLTFIEPDPLNTWGGTLYNGVNYDEESSWGMMGISWDEVPINDDLPLR